MAEIIGSAIPEGQMTILPKMPKINVFYPF